MLEVTGFGASFQNYIVERSHLTLADMMRTILSGANLPRSYWSHEILHATYIKNRPPHKGLPNHLTPFDMYNGRTPDLTHLRVLGCRVTEKTRKTQVKSR